MLKNKAVVYIIIILLVLGSGVINASLETITSTSSTLKLDFGEGWIRAINYSGSGRDLTDTTDWCNATYCKNDTYIKHSNGNHWAATGANIQVAINSSSTGGTVTLPGCTTLTISKAIWMRNNTNLIGQAGTIIKLADAGNAMMINIGFKMTGSKPHDGKHNILIQGIHFDGNNDSQTWNAYYFGIAICGDSSNITIRDCRFNNTCTDMIWAYRIGGSSIPMKNILVEDCEFDTIEEHPLDYPAAVYLAGRYCTVRNCFIKDTYACGIIFEDYRDHDSSFNIAEGNHITGIISVGLYSESDYQHNNTMINNYIYNLNGTAYKTDDGKPSFWSVGIIVANYSQALYNTIENISFKGQDGVYNASIVAVGKCTIIGNKIFNNYDLPKRPNWGYGIFMFYSAKFVGKYRFDIKDNEIYDSYYGIFLGTSDVVYAQIESNVIEGCVRGLSVTSQINLSIMDNIIREFTSDGIFLGSSDNCTLIGNRLFSTDASCDGIEADAGSDGNIFVANHIWCDDDWDIAAGTNAASKATANIPAFVIG